MSSNIHKKHKKDQGIITAAADCSFQSVQGGDVNHLILPLEKSHHQENMSSHFCFVFIPVSTPESSKEKETREIHSLF